MRTAGGWSLGGLGSSTRLDRREVRDRLAGFDRWIVDELIETFEAAALTAMAAKRKPDAGAQSQESED